MADVQLFPTLERLRLDQLCDSARFSSLDKLDAYGQSKQYEHHRYDWDGRFRGYGPEADIRPGWYVPLTLRRPSARFQLAKLINRRLTAMVFGAERWPEVRCDGDPDAEDYAKTLAREAKLHAKLLEARDRGGACGTAVVSFKFLDGKPRVTVHNAKHIHVLRWADRDDFVIGAALKAYRYRRAVWSEGKRQIRTFYFARFWDETKEIVWDPIPEELAKAGTWSSVVRSYEVVHDYGECPVYWTQNLPDSEHEDGCSDFEGSCDMIDAINILLSATHKGTVANVDPTLVIKDDPGKNPGVVRKGSGHAIWSKNGAEYLELSGEGIKAALEEVKQLVQMVLDVAGVVLGDPDKMAAKAQSGAALKMLYLPMLNQCDQLRTQYGDGLLLRVLCGMLRAARKINTTAAGPIQMTADGRRIQTRPVVVLPPRVESESEGEAPQMIERTPGTSEHLTLNWPAYFKASAADVKEDVASAKEAQGTLISKRTAVKYTAHHFGVTDPDQELEQIGEERDEDFERMAEQGPDAFGGGGGFGGGGKSKDKGDDEGED